MKTPPFPDFQPTERTPPEPPRLGRQPPVVCNTSRSQSPAYRDLAHRSSSYEHFAQFGQVSSGDFASAEFAEWSAEFAEWMEQQFGSESYGALRVFDLFTLLSITLAFALLFSLMQLLAPALGPSLPTTTFGISLYVTSIALAQMLLLGGKKPRIASICAGPLIWQVVFGLLLIPTVIERGDVTPWLWVYVTSALGIPAGYLGGATVAGVFLIAEEFRQRYLDRFVPRTPPTPEDMWD